MEYFAGKFDVAVIGAGHAGIEAACAAAKLGCHTVIFTINLDSVGDLPCNPSIGGTAKGHLVREIDALGGEMGKAADATLIQSRMLNRGKGPAVHSLRAQIDRRAYGTYMIKQIGLQENLEMKQVEITRIERSGELWKLISRLGATFEVKAVIIATGTYLGGKIYVGDVSYQSGPDGMFSSTYLSSSLKALGLPLRRFKTGTPARVHKASINFEGLEVQPGDEPVVPFSYDTNPVDLSNKTECHITWTNDETKQIILDNLHRSPLYGGMIDGIGPRYCPSIEDKIVRFPDKKRHQVFIEPCGLDTTEMYLQGMSSSLPEDVQIALYRTVPGLENLQIIRNAYAIEYDCIDPIALKPTLEVINLDGLYGAGQFNGSSGYEEAAAQGLVAGINAARKILGLDEVILQRSGSYIGTLIDDLVTKGCADPYRMMTSRSEYRLVLRQDNADDRMMPTGYEIGLINEQQYERFLNRQHQKAVELARVKKTFLPPSKELNDILVSRETSTVKSGIRLEELLRRPTIDYDVLKPVDVDRPDLPLDIFERVFTEVKYEGYIKRQLTQIAEQKRLENKRLPEDTDYRMITGLSLEAIEKLNKVRPMSIGQAGRISGITPADISVLFIYMEKLSAMQKNL